MNQNQRHRLVAPQIGLTALSHSLLKAVELHRAGSLALAERQYRKILALLPNHPDANNNLAILLQQSQRHGEALPHLKRILEQNPGISQNWLRYIEALILAEHPAEARSIIEQAQTYGIQAEALSALAQRASTPSPTRIRALAELCHRSNHLDTEIAARMFIANYPAHVLGWQVLGVVLKETGRLAEAVEVSRQVIIRFPDDANAHNNHGMTLLALKEYLQAEESLRRSIEINPNLAEAHSNLGETLQAQGRLAEAAESYRRALTLKPLLTHAQRGLQAVGKAPDKGLLAPHEGQSNTASSRTLPKLSASPPGCLR